MYKLFIEKYQINKSAMYADKGARCCRKIDSDRVRPNRISREGRRTRFCTTVVSAIHYADGRAGAVVYRHPVRTDLSPRTLVNSPSTSCFFARGYPTRCVATHRIATRLGDFIVAKWNE